MISWSENLSKEFPLFFHGGPRPSYKLVMLDMSTLDLSTSPTININKLASMKETSKLEEK